MGGHLTHGSPVNMSGKWFNIVSYGLNDKEEIDYDQVERLARESKPKLILAGASAYALRMDFERFAKISKEVGAVFMVDMAHYAGLIAAGIYWILTIALQAFQSRIEKRLARGDR